MADLTITQLVDCGASSSANGTTMDAFDVADTLSYTELGNDHGEWRVTGATEPDVKVAGLCPQAVATGMQIRCYSNGLVDTLVSGDKLRIVGRGLWDGVFQSMCMGAGTHSADVTI